MTAPKDQLARSPNQVGEAVRRRRRTLGLTQATLGERTSLRQATISAIESGEAATQLRTLFDILAALDLELVIRPRSKTSPTTLEDIF